MRINSKLWTIASLIVGGVALGATVSAPACSPQRCSSDNPNVPLPALECPAGDLCYRGSCVRGCNAVQERRESCRGEDECSSARPFCRNGITCTACDEGDLCIDGLNVCAPSTTVETPPEPMKPGEIVVRPNFPLDPSELDGGDPIDPGFMRPMDAEVVEGRTEVTYTALVDLATEIDYSATGQQRFISRVVAIRVPDNTQTYTWNLSLTSPAILCDENPPDEFGEDLDGCGMRLEEAGGPNCRIIPLNRPGTPGPADIGEVEITDAIQDEDENGMTSPRYAILPDLKARFVAGSYETFDFDNPMMPATGRLVHSIVTSTSSEVDRDKRIQILGSGTPTTIGGNWPLADDNDFPTLHVPAKMVPEGPTLTMLRAGLDVAGGTAQDFTFVFKTDVTGAFTNENVRLRVEADRHMLECFTTEGVEGAVPELELQAGIVTKLLDLEKATNGGAVIPGGTRYPVTLERVSAVGFSVPLGVDNGPILSRVSGQVRSAVKTRMQLVADY